MRHSHRKENGQYKRRTWFSWVIIVGIIIMAIYSVFHARAVQSSMQTQPVESNGIIPAVYAKDAVAIAAAPEVNRRLAEVTGYTSRPEETDNKPCESASGVDICEMVKRLENVPADGICATNDYAFGTRLLVEGKGVCIVLDRMNSRYKPGTGHLDWYFEKDLAAAKEFGRKSLRIIKL